MKLSQDTQNSIAVIAPSGRFDFSKHREFRAACEQALGIPGISAISVDMKDVVYIDSSALGMLLLLKDMAEAAGQAVEIANSQQNVRKILDIANFDRLFRIS